MDLMRLLLFMFLMMVDITQYGKTHYISYLYDNHLHYSLAFIILLAWAWHFGHFGTSAVTRTKIEYSNGPQTKESFSLVEEI